MNVNIESISKSFGGTDIVSEFSLDLDSGVRLCVCGPNGSGKSTLLKIIVGEEQPDSGRVILPKNCRVGYVAQDFDQATLELPLVNWVQDVLPDWHDFWQDWDKAANAQDEHALKLLGARQSELEAVYGYNPEYQARMVLSGLGFTEDKWSMPIKMLSGGWRERAKLARVLVAGADVLLLDEPTNHLDIEAVEWLELFLISYKGVLIFVAHDRIFMDKVGTHVLYLGGGKPMFRKTNFTRFIEFLEDQEEQKEREHRRLNDEIERKLDFVRRFGAKATKARQAQSRQKMAKKLEKEMENVRPEPKRFRELSFKWPEPTKADKVIFAAADLAFKFSDGISLWPPLTFSVFNGQRIALVGHNGAGKSTLLKILAGHLEKSGGSLVTGSLVRMGYYSQHQTDILNINGTVLSEMRRLSDPRTTEEELMSVLGQFLLGRNYFDRFVSTLSGGEKARLVLASLFLARCNVLVLDEPTNHLDLESRDALVEALDNFEGTIIMVAHDRYLLSQVGEEAWEMTPQGLTVYEDGFEAYDEARRARLQVKDKVENTLNLNRDDQKRVKREEAARRNEIYKKLKPLQEKYKKQEQVFEALVTEQHNLEAQLALPETYADSEKTTSMLKRFNELKYEVEQALEKITVLEEEIKSYSGQN